MRRQNNRWPERLIVWIGSSVNLCCLHTSGIERWLKGVEVIILMVFYLCMPLDWPSIGGNGLVGPYPILDL